MQRMYNLSLPYSSQGAITRVQIYSKIWNI